MLHKPVEELQNHYELAVRGEEKSIFKVRCDICSGIILNDIISSVSPPHTADPYMMMMMMVGLMIKSWTDQERIPGAENMSSKHLC